MNLGSMEAHLENWQAVLSLADGVLRKHFRTIHQDALRSIDL
jgi:hypothetical protein